MLLHTGRVQDPGHLPAGSCKPQSNGTAAEAGWGNLGLACKGRGHLLAVDVAYHLRKEGEEETSAECQDAQDETNVDKLQGTRVCVRERVRLGCV